MHKSLKVRVVLFFGRPNVDTFVRIIANARNSSESQTVKRELIFLKQICDLPPAFRTQSAQDDSLVFWIGKLGWSQIYFWSELILRSTFGSSWLPDHTFPVFSFRIRIDAL